MISSLPLLKVRFCPLYTFDEKGFPDFGAGLNTSAKGIPMINQFWRTEILLLPLKTFLNFRIKIKAGFLNFLSGIFQIIIY